MSYIDFMEKQETLKRIIKSGKTGTAEELADRLCISRSTLFNHFNVLKLQCSYQLKFCRVRKTYYFDQQEACPNPTDVLGQVL